MINVIVGLMSSGKTLYMTYKLFQEYKKGKNIFTNYDLFFPNLNNGAKVIKINSDALLEFSKSGQNFRNSAFGLDEFWLFMDSRSSMSKSSKIFTWFFLQSSKDDTQVYLTTQHANQIDTRIRNNLHKITQCSRAILDNGKYRNISDEQRFLSPNLTSRLYIKVQEFKRANIGFVSEIVLGNKFYIKAEPIFRFYDTTQKMKQEVKNAN